MKSVFALILTLFTFVSAPEAAPAPKPNPLVQLLSFEIDPPRVLPHEKPVAGKKYAPHLKLDEMVADDIVTALINEIKLDNEDKADAIILEINSPGGYVDAGFKLTTAIEESKAPVYCVVDGEAASMAYYILQSCEVRMMTKRSILMAHEPGGGVRGQPTQIANGLAELDALTDAVIEHFAFRTKLSFREFKAKVHGGKEYWMPHREATRIAAVDFVVTTVAEVERTIKTL